MGCIIIARLVLGYPYFATGPLKQLKTEPLRDEANVSQGPELSSFPAVVSFLWGFPSHFVHKRLLHFEAGCQQDVNTLDLILPAVLQHI